MAESSNSESLLFCILCPLFGPAFYLSGMCTRPRFLVALAIWLALLFSIIGLITKFGNFRPRDIIVRPATENNLHMQSIVSPTWCSGAYVSLASTELAPYSEVLSFNAFASSEIPPVNISDRMIFEISRYFYETNQLFPFFLDLPLTNNSFITINASSNAWNFDSTFRLSVLEGEDEWKCWNDNALDQNPKPCSQVSYDQLPINVTLSTKESKTFYIVVTTSSKSSHAETGLLELKWNISRYQRPPQLKHAGPICYMNSSLGIHQTRECYLPYDVDGESRRQVNVEVAAQKFGVYCNNCMNCSFMTDVEHTSLLNHVFPENLSDDATAKPDSERLQFKTLAAHIKSVLMEAESSLDEEMEKPEDTGGRIGPPDVHLDPDSSQGGRVSLCNDRLWCSGKGEFTTICANCCVFSGKWMYEVYLRSKGVMQLGWATKNCKFSRQRGVGDTPNSYAYDGSRVRKWNVRPTKYGQEWSTEDVITCCMDASEGTVKFYRNGVDLGNAFDQVRLGPGFAYYPAVSISDGEAVEVNFGVRPFIHPLEDYSPLQTAPLRSLARAHVLFDHLDRLLPMAVDSAKQETADSCDTGHFARSVSTLSSAGASTRGGHFVTSLGTRSLKTSCWLIGSHLVQELSPLLRKEYIIDFHLVPFLLKFCDCSLSADHSHVHTALDMLWAFLREEVLHACLLGLVHATVRRFVFSSMEPSFRQQRQFLFLMLSIMKHTRSRVFFLRNGFTHDKVHLFYCLHLKQPQHESLSLVVPDVCWKLPDYSASDEEGRLESRRRQHSESYQRFLGHVQQLQVKVEELEAIQVEIVKCLLQDGDLGAKEGESSRSIFTSNLRRLLSECYGKRDDSRLVLPSTLLLHMFHLILRAVRFHYSRLVGAIQETLPAIEDLFVPVEFFCAGTASYLDVQRVGGLLSHLRKLHREELNSLGRGDRSSSHDKKSGFFSLRTRHEERRDRKERRNLRDRVCEGCANRGNSANTTESETFPSMPSSTNSTPSPTGCAASFSSQERLRTKELTNLIEIVDALVLLFHVGGYHRLVQMASIRESLHEFAHAFEETQDKLLRCPQQRSDIRSTLKIAKDSFHTRLKMKSRQQAWVMASCFLSKAKQNDVYWLFRCLLATFSEAKQDDAFFPFIPDFYVEATIRSFHVICAFFAPSLSVDILPGYSSCLVSMAQFLVRGFTDKRIVSSEAKDSLLQSLACFTCYPTSLQSLEAMPSAEVDMFVRCLLTPYEERAWAQTNWILVRLWKGCGFAFRYTHLPYVPPSKNVQEDITKASHERPCPSIFYQNKIQAFLQSQTEQGLEFVRSLLQQANWAFSEFVGALQELQQVLSNRGDLHITDTRSRQMRVCRTCFEIAVGLLRVLEMVAHLTPEYFLDWSRPQAETFASRLFQLLCQILNRISPRGSLFETFVQAHLSGLESVGYFPILTAVTGILLQLLTRGEKANRDCGLKALVNDPSFQISALHFLLSTRFQTATEKDGEQGRKKKERFCLTQFKEVSTEEVTEVERLVDVMQQEQQRIKSCSEKFGDEELCSICYALPMSAVFRPCGHKSCKTCITFQMINKPECFYCKAFIKKVEDYDGKEIRFK